MFDFVQIYVLIKRLTGFFEALVSTNGAKI